MTWSGPHAAWASSWCPSTPTERSPIQSSADTIFVSLDGLRETNDALRGPVFDRVLANVAASDHPNLLVNYTINTRNRPDVAGFCHLVRETPNLRGVFFYFHTPYYGFDDLYLDAGQRQCVVQELLGLKRQGLPVLNSVSALKAAASGRWKRPSDLCLVWANDELYTCCRALGKDEVCETAGTWATQKSCRFSSSIRARSARPCATSRPGHPPARIPWHDRDAHPCGAKAPERIRQPVRVSSLRGAGARRWPDTVDLYLHVPFCRNFCPYCPYYKEAYDPDRIAPFVAAVQREIALWSARAHPAG